MTATLFSETQLIALGLSASALEDQDLILWPESATTDGLATDHVAVGTSLADVLSGAAEPLLAAIGLPRVHSAGCALDVYDRIVRLRPRGGAVRLVRSEMDVRTGWGHPAADSGTLCVDLSMSGAVLVEMPDGSSHLFAARKDGLCYANLRSEPIYLEPLPTIEAPTWVLETADGWLRSEIERRLAIGGRWENAVAVGLFARLGVESAAGTKARVDAALEGRRIGRTAPTSEWAAALSPAQLRTLEALAVAKAPLLMDTLEALLDEVATADPEWVEDVRFACHARDDLEGVRGLLRQAGAGADLERALAQLDGLGERFFTELPVRLRISDERLERVGDEDPLAWWAQAVIDA